MLHFFAKSVCQMLIFFLIVFLCWLSSMPIPFFICRRNLQRLFVLRVSCLFFCFYFSAFYHRIIAWRKRWKRVSEPRGRSMNVVSLSLSTFAPELGPAEAALLFIRERGFPLLALRAVKLNSSEKQLAQVAWTITLPPTKGRGLTSRARFSIRVQTLESLSSKQAASAYLQASQLPLAVASSSSSESASPLSWSC